MDGVRRRGRRRSAERLALYGSRSHRSKTDGQAPSVLRRSAALWIRGFAAGVVQTASRWHTKPRVPSGRLVIPRPNRGVDAVSEIDLGDGVAGRQRADHVAARVDVLLAARDLLEVRVAQLA